MHGILGTRRLFILLLMIVASGFLAMAVGNYYLTKRSVHESVSVNELPMAANNIYSEIQRELLRPTIVSSTMAHDSFVRDWVLDGEKDPAQMARYLREVSR